MKKVLLVFNENDFQVYGGLMNEIIHHKAWGECTFEKVVMEKGKEKQTNILASDPEAIVSINMAGFEYRTLLENYLYNILPVKQLHVIIDEAIWNKYKEEDFAINLFLYIAKDKINGLLKEAENPNIKYYSKENIAAVVEDFVLMAKIQ